jgi:hypothetical protein
LPKLFHRRYVGFDYKFNRLDLGAAPDEFDEAFTTLTSSGTGVMSLVKAYVPVLRAIVSTMPHVERTDI